MNLFPLVLVLGFAGIVTFIISLFKAAKQADKDIKKQNENDEDFKNDKFLGI